MILYQYWLYVARSQHLWCRYGLNLGANWLAPKLFSFVFPFLFALFSSFFTYFFLMFFLIFGFSSCHPFFLLFILSLSIIAVFYVFLWTSLSIPSYPSLTLSLSYFFFFSSFIMCPSSPYVGLLTSGLIPSKIALSNPLSPSNES